MSERLPETKYLDPEVLQKLGDLELIAREVVEGLRVGSHRSPLRGFSTEFAHHRQYVPGDSLKTIDWRVYGRSDRYYTKLYEAETNFDCHLLIDSSSSMTYGSGKVGKLEYAKFLGASLAYLVLKQRIPSVIDFRLGNSGLPASRSTMGVFWRWIDCSGTSNQPQNGHRKTIERPRPDDEETVLRDRPFRFPFRSGRRFSRSRIPQVRRHTAMVCIPSILTNWSFLSMGLGNSTVWRARNLITQPERIKEDYLANLNEYLKLPRRVRGQSNRLRSGGHVQTLDVFLNEFFHQRIPAERIGGQSMSFLNPLLLVAAIGCLPILAHLLNRQLVKRTDWAAMQFLNRNLRVRARQLRLRDILLLILRCLALLLLVLALSRPYWQAGSGGWFGGEPRAGIVLAIDSSFSMGHGSEGTSRFDRALEQAKIISESIRPGDPVSRVLGGQDEVLVRNMAFDQERFGQLLEKPNLLPGSTQSRAQAYRVWLDDMDAPEGSLFHNGRTGPRLEKALLEFPIAFPSCRKRRMLRRCPTWFGETWPLPNSVLSRGFAQGTTARYQHHSQLRIGTGRQPRSAVSSKRRSNRKDHTPRQSGNLRNGLFVRPHNAGPRRITLRLPTTTFCGQLAQHGFHRPRTRIHSLRGWVQRRCGPPSGFRPSRPQRRNQGRGLRSRRF